LSDLSPFPSATPSMYIVPFFINYTATPYIYTLSLHDALPISVRSPHPVPGDRGRLGVEVGAVARHHLRPLGHEHLEDHAAVDDRDRKSTRLNSSHVKISYAVFCLKKKKNKKRTTPVNSRLNTA